MKYSLAVVMFLLMQMCAAQTTGVPFSRGVNLTNWLQESSARSIQRAKYTKTDFEHIKSLGCDVIRLPINLHAMTSGSPDYTIDPLLFDILDRAVDWAEELGLHIIIDNHSFDPAVNTTAQVQTVLIPVWKQMAAHMKNRSSHVYYEVLNEPHGINDLIWNAIQKMAVDSIRSVDTKHTIVIGPAGWNSYNNLAMMPAYADTNLIYTFHFYDPMVFTHQGASWTDPSLVPLAQMPFPYDALSMPAFPAVLNGTWVQNDYRNYASIGNAEHVKSLIDIAVNFKTARGIRLFCGEFGVYSPNSLTADRARWYQLVRTYLEAQGIGWTSWDYQGGFGLFNAGSSELFDYDLNIPVLTALGLTVPPQKPLVITPDTTVVVLYADEAGPGIRQTNSSTGADLDVYASTAPAEGSTCIRWANAAQYDNLAFGFAPTRDLSVLRNAGYALELRMRTSSPDVQLDVRFIDTKTGVLDHPWRMGKTITSTDVVPDGLWHRVRIPLASLAEQGSWDGTWYNPVGQFNWKAVDRFELVAERASLAGKELWFDDIRITNAVTSVADASRIPDDFTLAQNFPNPFNPSTTIRFGLPAPARVTLRVFDVMGRQIAELVNGEQDDGWHEMQWSAHVASGVYFYRLDAVTSDGRNIGSTHMKRMTLLK